MDAAAILEQATRTGDPPAASCCAIQRGAIVHESAHGSSPDGRRTTTGSVFDVASVTKILATTSAVAVLVSRGELDLDAPVTRWLPAFAAHGKGRVTPRELLGHRSGLPAWRPFFAELMSDRQAAAIFDRDTTAPPETWARARQRVLDAVFDAPLEQPGRRVYSDLGFITLGALVEAIAGSRLDAFCDETLWRSLPPETARRTEGPRSLHARPTRTLGFVDLTSPTSWLDDRHVLPTGRTRPREPAPGQEDLYEVPPQPERPDAGHVDDDNAFAMGGIAGHAGVFGTARAVARFGAALLEELDGANQLGCGDVIRGFFTIDPAREGSPRGLGFDVPTGPRSSAGARLGDGPRGAFGHLGFTGCSLWLDLDRGLSVALLTNRTFPGRHRVEGIRALRPAVHDAIVDAL